jgi:hypothetical protein
MRNNPHQEIPYPEFFRYIPTFMGIIHPEWVDFNYWVDEKESTIPPTTTASSNPKVIRIHFHSRT